MTDPDGPQDIAIRRANAADLDRLLQLETVFQTDRLSRRSFKRHLTRSTQALLVAVQGKEVVGYALVSFRTDSRSARLYSLAVAPEAGRGIGRMLLAGAQGEARKRTCIALRLEVRENNDRAIKLYERAGFVRIGRRDNYYADGAAALIYRIALSGEPLHALAGEQVKAG